MKIGASPHCMVSGSTRGAPHALSSRPVCCRSRSARSGQRPVAASTESNRSSGADDTRAYWNTDIRVASAPLDGSSATIDYATSSEGLAIDGIGRRAEMLAVREEHRSHAEAMHRLADLEADDTGADDRHRARQIAQLEDVIVDEHRVAHAVQRRRDARLRAGGDDHRPRLDPRMVVHREHRRREEARPAVQALLGGKRLDVVEDEADEPIALAAHPLHDGAPVDAHALYADAEAPGAGHVVRDVGGGDQQLRRHAADAGAVVPPPPDSINTTVAPAAAARARAQAGAARSDDRDVDPLHSIGTRSHHLDDRADLVPVDRGRPGDELADHGVELRHVRV